MIGIDILGYGFCIKDLLVYSLVIMEKEENVLGWLRIFFSLGWRIFFWLLIEIWVGGFLFVSFLFWFDCKMKKIYKC